MNRITFSLCAAVLSAASVLSAQSSSSDWTLVAPESSAAGGAIRSATLGSKPAPASRPFSRFAIGGGIALNGINLQAATNLNRYVNVRAVGNLFNYNANDISTNGFDINAKLNFATAGASVDFYPFPRHGFRLSPGILFYNGNHVSANGVVQQGQSITLNDQDYYSQSSDPLTVNARVGLNTNKRAFTMTTGWGNMISRRGGHWSFPVEVGVAFVGSPTMDVTLTGSACTDATQTQCANLNSNAEIAQDVQTNLNAQIAKWKSDLDPLKTFPIVSFGVSYNFPVRSVH